MIPEALLHALITRPGLVVGCGWYSLQLRRYYLFHLPNTREVGIYVALSFAVEDLLTIQIDFDATLPTRLERDRNITAVGPEELIRHPRGGRMVLSRYAVYDLYMGFALTTSHIFPPSVLASSRPSSHAGRSDIVHRQSDISVALFLAESMGEESCRPALTSPSPGLKIP